MVNPVDAHAIMDGVATHTSQVLVGRDAELAEIASLLGVRPVPGQEPSAVLLSGDAGVGKTRLLTELRDLAFTEGWQVFAGHCLDFGDSALPYLPFSEVLGRLAVDLPDVVETVAPAHPSLARLQPGRRVLGAPDGSIGPESSALDRADLFEAVHALLEAASAKAPLLLVIEDAHWADQSTRDMLSFLFSRSFDGPVAVVASYRSDDLHRRHPLRRQVAEWSRIRGVERIQLAPLPAPDVRTLIAELHADALDECEIADIVDRAEGNAFFVEELVGAVSGPGRWVPDDLADVLLVRLDRLDDTARQVVRVASVAGRKVSHEMLTAASGLAGHRPRRGSAPGGRDERPGRRARATTPSGTRCSARRCTTTSCPASGSGSTRRTPRRCAAARPAGTAAELARHARLAMDLPTALTASVRAGDEASAVGGPDEAAQHYEQALELLADPRARRAVGRGPVQAGRQGRRRADGQRPPDPGRRPGRRAARPAAGGRTRRRTGRGCSPHGPTRWWSWRPTRTRSRSRAAGRRPGARGAPAACGPRSSPCTRGSCRAAAGSRRRRPSAWRRSRWPSGSTSRSWPPRRSPR